MRNNLYSFYSANLLWSIIFVGNLCIKKCIYYHLCYFSGQHYLYSVFRVERSRRCYAVLMWSFLSTETTRLISRANPAGPVPGLPHHLTITTTYCMSCSPARPRAIGTQVENDVSYTCDIKHVDWFHTKKPAWQKQLLRNKRFHVWVAFKSLEALYEITFFV